MRNMELPTKIKNSTGVNTTAIKAIIPAMMLALLAPVSSLPNFFLKPSIPEIIKNRNNQ